MNEEVKNKLLNDFKDNREKIHVMIKKLEKHIDKVEKDMEKMTKDYRSGYVFDAQLKLLTEYFKLILDMRKEIGKSIKEEISLRAKINIDDDEDKDIHEFMKKIEFKIYNQQEKLKELKEKTNEK